MNLSCPRCRRAEISALAVDEEQNLQRFQCRSCGENFTGPALPLDCPPQGSQQRVESPQAPALPGFAHVPIAAPEPSDVRVLEDQPVGKCEKCGKPYYRLGKRFEEHVRDCKGGPYVVYRRRAPRAGGSAPTGTPAPVTVAQLLPVAMPAGTGKALDISIEALKVQRSVLEAEIGELNRTIMTLEKLKGLGGVSSAPFTPPAEPAQAPPEAPPEVPRAETPSETASAPAGA